MAEARIPPRYVNVPVRLLYEVVLPPSVRLTGMRIYGLGWNHNYEFTDPISFDRLRSVCGLSRRQMFDHLRVLVNRGVLRYTYAVAAGIYVFDLRPIGNQVVDGELARSAENRTGRTLLDVVAHDHEEKETTTTTKEGGVGETEACGNPHCLEVLERMGVLEPTCSEIAGLAWVTVEYLEAWEAWLREREGKVGVGLLIRQMRTGKLPPGTRDRGGGRERYREWQSG